MHELSVCLALLQQVESIVRERRAERVTRIELRVGPLSGVEPALLRQAWPLACAGTRAEHADLVIDTVDVVVRCTVCGAESTVPPNRLLCGSCGDYRTRISRGDEMVLQRLELEYGAAGGNNPGPDPRSTGNP